MATKKAVIYTRVSLDQTGEGRSNDRQAEACRKLADLRDFEVIEEFSDISISAYSGKERPAWERVLERVNEGSIDVVLAYHMDRMTRSMTELEKLITLCEAKGVGVVTVSGDIDLTTDVGRMVARILAAVARAEIERKSARQKLAHEQRAKAGRALTIGVQPFGYDTDYTTVIPEQAEAIRKAARDALAGVSAETIAKEWIDKGFVSSLSRTDSPTGRAWTGAGVRYLLRNPRYAGLSTYKGEVVGEAEWDAILDIETHYALHERFKPDPRRHRTGKAPVNLLTGLMVCSKCGTTSRATRRGKVLSYSCYSNCIYLHRERAEEFITALVLAWLSDPAHVDELVEQDVKVDVEGLRKEIERLTMRLETYTREAVTAGLSPMQIRVGSEVIQGELDLVEREYVEAVSESTIHDLMDGREFIASRWTDLSIDRQREIVKLIIAEMRMLPVEQRGRRNVPMTERIELTWAE